MQTCKNLKNNLPLTLNTNRKKTILMSIFIILFSGLLFTLSVWMYYTESSGIALFASIFTFILLFISLFALIKKIPICLILNDEEFIIKSSEKNEQKIKWEDIEYFSVLEIKGMKYPIYHFSKESRKKRPVGGYIVPGFYDLSGTELTVLLETYRKCLNKNQSKT